MNITVFFFLAEADFSGVTFEIMFVFLVASDEAIITALLGVLEWTISVEDFVVFFDFEIIVSSLVFLVVVVIVFVVAAVVVFMIRVVGGINFIKSVGSETESKLYIL